MMRRLLVAAVVSACVMCSGAATAASTRGGSPGASHGAARASSSTKGRAASSKPVHVKAYTKKDGTRVEAHDRKAPEPKTSAPHAEPVPAPPPPIRLVRDPVTGQRTFTNEPLALLPAKALPSMALTVSTRAPTSVRTSAAMPVTGRQTISIAPSSATIRDARGRIQRSDAARHAFARQTGYPNGRPGYIIDHVKPLACGGADAPSNMQWQTITAAKAKDKVERVGCR